MIRNEQTKLTANWLNTIGAGTFVVGVVTPIIHGEISFSSLVGAIVAALAGYIVHRIARARLEELTE